MYDELRRGIPGFGSERTASPRNLQLERPVFLRGGVIIDGAKSRDPLNSPVFDLRAGLFLGKITASGKWAPSILGVTVNAYADNETELDVSVATAVEIVRRIGATGTLKLTGPPTAAGTVATVSVTYTAVNTSTGVITVPDLNAAFVAGSLIQPADGSETIKGVFFGEDGYSIRATDFDGNDRDISVPWVIVGTDYIDVAALINYPADTSLKAWVKAALRSISCGWLFSDDFA